MTIQTETYVQKPFYVEKKDVTAENMAEVAKWCGGNIMTDDTLGPYIFVDFKHAKFPRMKRAYVGDIVLEFNGNFKFYTTKAFNENFEKVTSRPLSASEIMGIPKAKVSKTFDETNLGLPLRVHHKS